MENYAFEKLWSNLEGTGKLQQSHEVDSSRVVRVAISVQSIGSSVRKSDFAFSAFTGVFLDHCSKNKREIATTEIDNNNLQQTNDKYTVRHQMIAVDDDVCRMRLSGQTAAMTTTTTTTTMTTKTTMTLTTMRTENP